MRIVDLNILLYAINEDAAQHKAAKRFWGTCVQGEEAVGLPWSVTLGFLRISTRTGLFPRPLKVDEALSTIGQWLTLPAVNPIVPGDRHWDILATLIRTAGTAGNLTTDAHLAALAIEYGATLYSADDDFKRFGKQLRFSNPL